MTELDKIKNEIADEYGFDDWQELTMDSTYFSVEEEWINKIAERYATTMCNQQKEIIAHRLQGLIAKEVIVNSPLPEELK